MSEEQIAKIKQTAEDFDARYHNDYSGRGMFGQLCVSIYCNAGEANDIISDVGIKGARTDNMGRGQVVYWPDIQEGK